MDKSAVSFQDNPDRPGANYSKVKPDIGSAKPSNLRAKFENLVKEREEEDQKRAAEQKRLREEKDRLDREMAQQQNKVQSEVSIEKPQRKGQIETGRTGGVGNAINRFNQPQEEPVSAPAARKEPIKLPKVATVVTEPTQENTNGTMSSQSHVTEVEQVAQIEEAAQPHSVIQPDVIPTQRESAQPELIETLPPPASFQNETPHEDEASYQNIQQPQQTPEPVQEEAIYSNIDYNQSNGAAAANPAASAAEDQANYVTALVGNEDHNLADYIEDTGVKATALYDYQATADDEISFDPNDIITHIEQIDEGWWRGLCKNRFGLFPANYVQLQ